MFERVYPWTGNYIVDVEGDVAVHYITAQIESTCMYARMHIYTFSIKVTYVYKTFHVGETNAMLHPFSKRAYILQVRS